MLLLIELNLQGGVGEIRMRRVTRNYVTSSQREENFIESAQISREVLQNITFTSFHWCRHCLCPYK